MPRFRRFFAIFAVAATFSGCGDVGNGSGPDAVGAAAAMIAPTFEVGPIWPMIPNDWVFGITSGLSIDADNNIWVLHRPRTVPEELADRAAPPVMVFDTEGNFIQGSATATSGRVRSTGFFVDHDGFVWIAGSGQGDDQLLKFTTEGEFVMQIGRANQSGGNTDTGNVNRPADVYVYPPTNELFVADGYGNWRVIVFDAETGEFCRMWDAFGNPPTDRVEREVPDGSSPEHFDLAHGVRVSNDGQVYVSERAGMRLQVFSIEGEYITQLMMGRTEPDPGVTAECVGETAHGRSVAELIENVATAH